MKRLSKVRQAALLNGALLLLVIGSAVGIGAVHAPVLAGFGVVAVVFSSLVALGLRRTAGPAPPIVFWTILIAAIWAFVQSLPVGPIFGILTGSVGDLWELADLDQARISGNFAVTAATSLKASIGALLVLAGFYYFHHSDRIDRFIDVVIGSATIVTALALAQSWLHLDTVLFFYQPEMGPVRPGLRGPFVNPDHYGAYLAIATLLATARGVVLHTDRIRFLYQALSVLLAAGLVLSYSVSAWIGFCLGFFGLWFAWRKQRSRVGSPVGVGGPLVVAGVFLGALMAIMGIAPMPGDPLTAQSDAIARLPEIWMASVGIAAANPVTGVGSGTVSDLLSAKLSAPSISVFFLRNQLLQFFVDFGVFVGVILLLGFATCFRHLKVGWHTEDIPAMVPVSAAVWGVIGIACFDFALEIPAIGIVSALLLGALCAQGQRYRRTKRGERSLLRKLRRAVGQKPGLTVAIAALGVIVTSGWSVLVWSAQRSATNEFRLAIESSEADVARVEAATESVLSFRPGASTVYVERAIFHLEAGDLVASSAWIERALSLMPGDTRVLTVRATLGLELGDAEGAFERIVEAMEQDPSVTSTWIAVLLTKQEAYSQWTTATEHDALRTSLADALMDNRRYFEAIGFGSHLLSLDSRDTDGLSLAARGALALHLDELALHYAGSLLAIEPADPIGIIVTAQITANNHGHTAAFRQMEGLVAAHIDDYRVLAAYAELMVSAAEEGIFHERYDAEFQHLRDQLGPVAVTTPSLTTQFHTLIARYHATRYEWLAVVSAANQGLALTPEDSRLLHLLASAERAMATHERAGFRPTPSDHPMRDTVDPNGELVRPNDTGDDGGGGAHDENENANTGLEDTEE